MKSGVATTRLTDAEVLVAGTKQINKIIYTNKFPSYDVTEYMEK